MTAKRAPIIGITLDYEEGSPTGYSKMPWYALRENYCSSVSQFGALPVPLAHEVEQVDAYIELLDGLIITGGAFDVPPAFYGESSTHETVVTKDRRTAFEFSITRRAIAKKIPVLGICGGQQLLNVVLGGTLIQHIPDSVANALEHEQKNPRTEPGHSVSITENTLLYRILTSPSPSRGEGRGGGETSAADKNQPHPNPPPQNYNFGGRELVIEVNSAHHQAVATIAPGAVVNAVAPDGVIEGLELPDHPFCLGVQWHPEYFVTDADRKIMSAFVEACRTS